MKNSQVISLLFLLITCAYSWGNVRPVINCISKLNPTSNKCLVIWGYINDNQMPFGQLTINYGPNNQFSPPPSPRSDQPEEFIPGIHSNVFTTIGDCNQMNQQWKIQNNIVSTDQYEGVVHQHPSKCLKSKCSSIECKRKTTEPNVCKKRCEKEYCRFVKKPYIDCSEQKKELKKCDQYCKEDCRDTLSNDCPDCGKCDGKVNSLTLQYNGNSTTDIQILDKKCEEVFDTLNGVEPESNFTLTRNPSFPSEICLKSNETTVKIHTSCSQPIGIGSVFGEYEVLAGSSRNGGAFCKEGETPSKYSCKERCRHRCHFKCKKKCILSVKKEYPCVKKFKKVLKCNEYEQKKCYKNCCNTFVHKCTIKNKSAVTVHLTQRNKGGSKKHSKHEIQLSPIELPADETPQDFYAYGNPGKFRTNSGLEDQFREKLRDRLWITFLKHKQNNEMYMMLVTDVPNDGSGGSLDYMIETKRKWPNNMDNQHYYPLLVKDDPNDQRDNASWNMTKLKMTSEWNPKYADGSVFGGIHGCYKFKITEVPDGIREKTIAFIEYRGNQRRVVETRLHPKLNTTITFCPSCLKNDKGCHGGFRPCDQYDRCGVCNGDNSTCSKPPKCTNCGKVDVFQKTVCKVKHVESTDKHEPESFVLKAGGSYTRGKEEVTVDVNCKNEEDSQELNDKWIVKDIPCLGQNNTDVRLTIFKQKITLACLYRCFSGKKNYNYKKHHKHHHESVLHGILKITSKKICDKKTSPHKKPHLQLTTTTKKCEPKTFYYVPCKFNIHSRNCGIDSIHYTIHQPNCKVKLLEQKWVTPWKPKDLVLKFMTCVSKPHGYNAYLTNPTVLTGHETGNVNVEFLPPMNSTCIVGHPHAHNKCCQTWQLRTVGGRKDKCFSGVHPLKFNLVVPGHEKLNHVVKMKFFFKENKLCKPTPEIHTRHKGYKIKIKGIYGNKQLTYKTKHFVPYQRVFVPIKMKGLEKSKCDEFDLKITTARLCFSKNTHKKIKSCKDEHVTVRTIWDFRKGLKFNGGCWKTKVSSVCGKERCTSMKTLSFNALIFQRWETRTDIILEVEGKWHHHISGHKHFTISKKINEPSVSLWSSENLLNNINEIRKKDEQFSENLLHTYYSKLVKVTKKSSCCLAHENAELYGGPIPKCMCEYRHKTLIKKQDFMRSRKHNKRTCRKRDGCGNAWIVIRCPPHEVFVPSHIKGRPGKCRTRPIIEMFSCLFKWWLAPFWILGSVLAVWFIVVVVAICASPEKYIKPHKCHSDCHHQNKYYQCKKCKKAFGCKRGKPPRCVHCMNKKRNKRRKNKRSIDKDEMYPHAMKFDQTTKKRKNKKHHSENIKVEGNYNIVLVNEYSESESEQYSSSESE